MGSRLWLVAPAMTLFVGDVGMTLSGQPESYWAGDYGTALEKNPIAYPLLVTSPWLFAGLAIVWLAALSTLLLTWRHPVSDWMVVGVALAHAVGGATWLARLGGWGWVAAGVYIAVAARLSGWCWQRYARGRGPESESSESPSDLNKQ